MFIFPCSTSLMKYSAQFKRGCWTTTWLLLEPYRAALSIRSLGDEIPEDETRNRAQLDEDVQTRSTRVLEGITNCVARHRVFVCRRALTQDITFFIRLLSCLDVFLCVIPCTSGVAHADCHLHT